MKSPFAQKLRGKEYQRGTRLDGFHSNDHTLGFQRKTQKSAACQQANGEKNNEKKSPTVLGTCLQAKIFLYKSYE